MSHTISKKKILRILFFIILCISIKTFNSIFPFPSTIRLSQGKLFKKTQISNLDSLCALNIKFYSTILFLTLRSAAFNFKTKSNTLVIQSLSSKTIVPFWHLATSSLVESRLFLAASLLNL